MVKASFSAGWLCQVSERLTTIAQFNLVWDFHRLTIIWFTHYVAECTRLFLRFARLPPSPMNGAKLEVGVNGIRQTSTGWETLSDVTWRPRNSRQCRHFTLRHDVIMAYVIIINWLLSWTEFTFYMDFRCGAREGHYETLECSASLSILKDR